MKNIGATRRIDSLGRIVIPNEYRKLLHIKQGELLELFVEEDRVVITKHNVISKNDSFLKIYLNLLKKHYKLNVCVANNEEVIYANDNYFNKNINLLLNDNNIQKIPINPRGDLLGYIMVLNNDSVDKNVFELSNSLIKSLFDE